MTLIDSSRIAKISQKFALLTPAMDERQTRLWLAAEAKAIGRGGLAAVTAATGVLRKRIGMGIRELEQMARNPPPEPPGSQRIRNPGDGRKKLTDKDATLVDDFESLVAPETRGDPESLLRWTTKSVRKLAEQLCEMGHSIGRQKVSELLHELGYSLQSLSKTREGTSHPDRDAQFRHINRKARDFQARGEPGFLLIPRKRS